MLAAESIPNAYILESGINGWLDTFAGGDTAIRPLTREQAQTAPDTLRYTFDAALGNRYAAAAPNPHTWELEYTPKVKLELQRDKSGGGCG